MPASVENISQSVRPTAGLSPAPARARTLWERRVRDPIVVQLKQGITPEKIALTLAVGSACALFPAFGVTSLLCFLAALALRLNQPIIQILNQILLPAHIATFVLCVRWGERLFGVPEAERFPLRPDYLLEYFDGFWFHPLGSLASFAQELGESLFYAVVVWALLLPIYVPLVYYSLRPVMRGIVKVKAGVVAKKSAVPPPSGGPGL
jgi:hypothetical protein